MCREDNFQWPRHLCQSYINDNYTDGGGSGWGVCDNLHCAVDTEEAVELEMFIFIFYLSIHGKQFFSEGGLLFVAIQGRFFSYHAFSTILTHIINPIVTFACNLNIRRSNLILGNITNSNSNQFPSSAPFHILF